MTDINIKHPEDKDIKILKKLWIETFGDTEKYVNLVFKRYYNPEYCLVAYDQESIVASLIGIPYYFIINGSCLKGLYLCGLLTNKDYRNRGIMSEMIMKVSEICDENFMSLLFLIPADDHLRNYYYKLGFRNSQKRSLLKISDNRYLKNFLNTIRANEDISILSKIENNHKLCVSKVFSNISGFIDYPHYSEIINRCIKEEEQCFSPHMIHTFNDWESIIEEKFLSGSILIFNEVSNLIFTVDDAGDISILSGHEEEIIELIKNLFNFLIESFYFKAYEKGQEKLSVEVSPMEISRSTENYGMIKFMDDIFISSCRNFISSENPIFENNRGIYDKYQKMKFDGFSAISKEKLSETISFRFMLD